MKRRTKKNKGLRKIFIVGAYWILFVAMMGIFATPLFKYSADAPKGYADLKKPIKTSVQVVKKGTTEGVAGQYVVVNVDLGKTILGKTGGQGFTVDGDFSLVQKDKSIYLQYGNTIVKTLYFYLSNEKSEKGDSKQVVMNVSPLISADKLDSLKPYADQPNTYRLSTVTLYSDKSGGEITGFIAANGTNSAESIASGEAVVNAVGVGVPIPAPGGPDSINNKTAYSYDQYICALYYWALNVGFGLTLLMFLYAGYRYMTAAGNDSVFTETKDVLTSAIMGFLLLLCIRLILHFLNVPEPGACFPNAAASSISVHTYAINNIVSIIP